MIYTSIIKPLADRGCALLALLISSPIFLLIAIIGLLVNKGRPFFKQERSGKHDALFTIYKFKTMTDRSDTQGQLLPDAQRLTAYGKFLRKTSLDELPQLFNVLKGDMSFIGPRPLPAVYLPLYSDIHATRNTVKPGISGWAQVNGRNAISWNRKFDLDVYYVQHLSLLLDLKILFKTIIIVFGSKGINAEGQATTVPYNGTN